MTGGLTPYEEFDEALESIQPNKVKDAGIVKSFIPKLNPTVSGYVACFDGAVRTKDPIAGAFSAIIFQLPSWNVVAVRGSYKGGLTVNESEYYGLIQVLTLARELDIRDLLVFGDSRIALHQVTGLLQCHKANLEVLLYRVRELEDFFDSVAFYHVVRKYNQAADYVATKTLQARASLTDLPLTDLEMLEKINKLPGLLYGDVEVTRPNVSAITRSVKGKES